MKADRLLIVSVVAAVLIVLVYLWVRSADIDKVEKQLLDLRVEQAEIDRAREEWTDLKGSNQLLLHVPEFVEQLHRFAIQTGVDEEYELSTLGNQGRIRGSGQTASNDSRMSGGLSMNRMKISLISSYRNIAEYLRLLQQLNSPFRIVAVTMRKENDALKMTMELELYSFRRANGIR
jgi:hypothetical protein